MKTKMSECPDCHEVEEVVGHLDLGLYTTETEGGDFYEFVTFYCRCYQCGKRWKEYKRLIYDGYYDPDTQRSFLSDGSEITN